MTEIPDARFAADSKLFIGGLEVPGLIAENGVTVMPGGHRNVNIIQVEFIVANVVVEDPTTDDC